MSEKPNKTLLCEKEVYIIYILYVYFHGENCRDKCKKNIGNSGYPKIMNHSECK